MVRLLALTAALPAAVVALRQRESEELRARVFAPSANCSWHGIYREDICYQIGVHGRTDPHPELKTRKGVINMTKLERNLWVMLRGNPSYRQDFFEAFDMLKKLNAYDVFATKESWTDVETAVVTDLIREHEYIPALAGPDGQPMNFTTENMQKLLPSWSDLDKLINGKSLAIVGPGKSLKKFSYGPQIDEVDHVVRFHSGVGSALNAKTTGTKHTIHVITTKHAGNFRVPTFDMDGINLVRSFCERIVFGGGKTHDPHAPLFMWSPQGFCKLPRRIFDFSKQFLFYWFIGSMYDDVTFFGMLDNSTTARFNNERFMEAEQAFYKQAAYQWSQANKEELSMVRGAKPPITLVS